MYESMIVFQKTLTCYLPEQPVMVTGTGSTVKEGNNIQEYFHFAHEMVHNKANLCILQPYDEKITLTVMYQKNKIFQPRFECFSKEIITSETFLT